MFGTGAVEAVLRGLGEIMQVLTTLLPPWALALVGLALLAWLLPGLRFRIRSRQVREAIRRMVRADPEQRTALAERAFERAGDDPHLLGVLATETWKRGMPRLRDEAVRRLEAQPRGRAELARIHREQRGPAPAPLHPLEVALRVRQLLASEAVEAARARLDEGLAHHPDHPDLLALVPLVRDAANAPPPLDSEPVER